MCVCFLQSPSSSEADSGDTAYSAVSWCEVLEIPAVGGSQAAVMALIHNSLRLYSASL
jgi:hypothetical protein